MRPFLTLLQKEDHLSIGGKVATALPKYAGMILDPADPTVLIPRTATSRGAVFLLNRTVLSQSNYDDQHTADAVYGSDDLERPVPVNTVLEAVMVNRMDVDTGDDSGFLDATNPPVAATPAYTQLSFNAGKLRIAQSGDMPCAQIASVRTSQEDAAEKVLTIEFYRASGTAIA